MILILLSESKRISLRKPNKKPYYNACQAILAFHNVSCDSLSHNQLAYGAHSGYTTHTFAIALKS